MKVLVSVVIPNYNGAPFLKRAIESVIFQTYSNIEIIVIDDGSTDNSLEVLAEFESKVTLLKSANLGAAAARNKGIRVALGEYIALMDSDDVWIKNKLELQIGLIESQSLDLVYCNGQEFSEETTSGAIHEARYSGDCYKYFRKFPTRGIIELGCSSAVFRSSLLPQSGIFDESFSGAAEDWDFFRRYSRYAKVGFCPEILVKYRRHSGSITARSTFEYYLGNKKAILKMFAEDGDIKFVERRIIWAKFHYMSAKSFLKRGQLSLCSKSIVQTILPIKAL